MLLLTGWNAYLTFWVTDIDRTQESVTTSIITLTLGIERNRLDISILPVLVPDRYTGTQASEHVKGVDKEFNAVRRELDRLHKHLEDKKR